MLPPKTILPFLLSLSFLQFHQVLSKSKVPLVVIFGDSSVDTGNNNQISTVLKSNFEPYGRDFQGGHATGRFSNGRVATDFISEAFGSNPIVPAYLDPAYSIADYVDAVCFASAGTGYDTLTSKVLNVLPLWKELEYFKLYQKELRSHLGVKRANSRIGKALYMMSIGTNDFLENYYLLPIRRKEYTVDQYEDYLANLAEKFIREIYGLGARKISLGGVPPMGCLPLERTANVVGGCECVEEYNKVAKDFNAKLQLLVAKLPLQLPGVQLVFTDCYDKFMEAIQNPSLYGFENVANGCCGTGLFEMGYLCDKWNPHTCSDANKYAFWDSFHPTEKLNRILADHVLNTSLARFL